MRVIEVQTKQGLVKEPVYTVKDFPYYKLVLAKLKTCRTRGKHSKTYFNISSAFDIETTSIDGIKDEKGKYVEGHRPYGFMYIWQFCICDMVCMGRTWEEFITFFNQIKEVLNLGKSKILVVYIHNLSYEFQFTRNFIQINDIFFADQRKPFKFSSDGFEFRCSYKLSNMSLEKFSENSKLCNYQKTKGDLDYKVLRTKDTPLTDEELGYCYNDVRGLCQCIDTLLLEDTIATIPLTSTGYVRRDARNNMKKNKANHFRFLETALTPHLYEFSKKAFRGGNTHANRIHVGKILRNVYSYDITSSYPTCMMIDEYPIGAFKKGVLEPKRIQAYLKNFCCYLKVNLIDVKLKDNIPVPYISISKCDSVDEGTTFVKTKNGVYDNGRIMEAKSLSLYITNVDWEIIRKQYTFSFEVEELWYATKGKLPKELREIVMQYYVLKTKLKGIPEKTYEYNKAKNKLNALYGMMVSAIDHDEILFNNSNSEYMIDKPILDQALEKYYNSKSSFLSYQWGIFVTANARKRLQDMIDIVGMDLVYTDTDSIKFLGKHHIIEFEKKNKELLGQALNNDIPAVAYNKDGKEFVLGLWDLETGVSKDEHSLVYKKFKTLGAKKYAYTQYDSKTKKDEFHITISGVDKKLGAKEMGCIENFNIGFLFAHIDKSTAFYEDINERKQITVNGSSFTTASNIALIDTTYALGITQEYMDLISNFF